MKQHPLRPLVFWPTFLILLAAVVASYLDLSLFLVISKGLNALILDNLAWLFCIAALGMVILALAMGLGSIVSRLIQSLGFTLPAYIGAMMVASVLRNLDDVKGWFRIDMQAMDFVGGFALNIFLVVALMDLKLWQLAGQALPLFVILAAQVVIIALVAITLLYRAMGRDYDAAVMAGGFIGFALGTTANAVANMRAICSRYGPAPRAFLVVPLVGAFFIDFTNALIITLFLNWLG